MLEKLSRRTAAPLIRLFSFALVPYSEAVRAAQADLAQVRGAHERNAAEHERVLEEVYTLRDEHLILKDDIARLRALAAGFLFFFNIIF